jgi:NAD-reducing hydrogenase small subunit
MYILTVTYTTFNQSDIAFFGKFFNIVDRRFIEGGVCNSENIHVLKEFRENCKILVSVGECAIMGGLPALRNNIPLRECLEEAYIHGPSVENTQEPVIPNDEDLPLILDKVYPCHEVVKIDYFLPGCPPRADLIYNALVALISGNPMEIPYESFKYD